MYVLGYNKYGYCCFFIFIYMFMDNLIQWSDIWKCYFAILDLTD